MLEHAMSFSARYNFDRDSDSFQELPWKSIYANQVNANIDCQVFCTLFNKF